jgi:hypothetical protein
MGACLSLEPPFAGNIESKALLCAMKGAQTSDSTLHGIFVDKSKAKVNTGYEITISNLIESFSLWIFKTLGEVRKCD